MIIIVDSREKKPYSFPCETTVAGLKAGDYSLVGYTDRVAIERKTKADAYGTIGKGRKRFVAEMERLQLYDYAAIVIECTFQSFLKPPRHSGLHPNAAINSLLAWSVRYRLPIFFCNNRNLAQTCAYRLLEKFWKEKEIKHEQF